MIQIHAIYKKLTLDPKTHKFKVKGQKDIFHADNQKKAGVVILISDKIDFKSKKFIKNKEEHYMLIKCLIQQQDITITNIYTPNKRP